MDRFIKFDAWLITHVFEPISWWFEYHHGFDCFKITRVCISLSYLLSALEKPSELMPGSAERLLISWGLFMFVLFFAEKRLRLSATTLNPIKVLWGLRFFYIAWWPIATSLYWDDYSKHKIVLYQVFFGGLGEFLFILAMYFIACNLMPPRWEPKPLAQLKYA